MPTWKKPSIVAFGTLLTALGTGEGAQAIVTTGTPENYVVPPGDFSGVALLTLNRSDGPAGCTGSLLTGGLHLLTAAHCLTDERGNFNVIDTTAIFELSDSLFSLDIADDGYFIFPDWIGDGINNEGFARGDDIAVLKLAEPAPSDVEQYDIYRGADEVGQVFTQVGYGQGGTGDEGAVLPGGIKRFGQNRFDLLDGIVPDSQLLFDFDNGLPENDAFGFFGISDLGLGINEVSTASGDSGGPSFIGNAIAGVVSYGFTTSSPPDIDTEFNRSFGEFASNTRVSLYAGFVDDAVAGKVSSAALVPEPSSVLGALAFGAWGASSLLRRKNQPS
ncbi:MAG: S1 family peptidase [Coleofasciculus sp. S288]|nr:S1 family peptidase [Coleofasciculus sp. S288]